MEKVVKPAAPAAEPKRCVPQWLTWNWHHNRAPRGRNRP